MSIRVRFTLVYSAILATVLLIFGVSIYNIQARTTLNTLRSELLDASFGVSRIIDSRGTNDLNPQQFQKQPKPFNEFFDQQQLRDLPEREIVRLLDSNGNLIASPFGEQTEELPFDTASLEQLSAGEDLYSLIEVDGETFLMINHPVFAHDSPDNQFLGVAQVARSLSERISSLRSLKMIFTFASIITLLIASAIGWWLSSYLLLPINKITHTAAEIREENDLSRRVQYEGPLDEVGILAGTFNQMLDSVESAYQQVAQSLQTQREFVADVSHELRTPLTTIRGNLGLLARKDQIADDEKDEILNDASEETKRLIRLVEALLDLARADTNRPLNIQPIDPSDIIEETLRQTRLLDPAREINFLPAEGEFCVDADPDAYKQILLIGLDNAIKHTHSHIDVRLEKVDGKVVTKVIDNGDGMEQQELDKATQRFYRAHAGTNVGFGLGLPIASALLANMGGQLVLNSKPCEGTRYEIWLPSGGQQQA